MSLFRIYYELFSRIFREFPHKMRRLRLNAQFQAMNLERHKPPIPSPIENSNQLPSSDIHTYVAEYLSLNQSVFPFVTRTAALKPNSLTLDFGCGFGTLAAAFASSPGMYGSYIGIDSNRDAIDFCRRAYSGEDAFKFGSLNRSPATNYVTNWSIRSAKQNYLRRQKCAPTLEEIKTFVGDQLLTCQFSLSVFTHMWPEDAIEALQVFRSFSTTSTRFINSWLILDNFATRQIMEGKADRSLPISIGGIRTYSELNPLVCTGYPLKLLEEVYQNAGHRILEVLYGSWAGRGNDVTYQDLVISERI